MIPLVIFDATLAVGFFNGANDVSKSIVTLVGSGVPRLRTAIIRGSFRTFAGAAGFRVTEMLARKVTPMGPVEGLVANLVTSILVVLASRLELPVSTTQLSSAAIISLGVRRNVRQVEWTTVRNLLHAWIVTLPAAGLMAALVYGL